MTAKIGGDQIEHHAEKDEVKAQKVDRVRNSKGRKMLKTIKNGNSHQNFKVSNMKSKQHVQKSTFHSKSREGPETDKPAPTVVFHGFKQSCWEDKIVENVNAIREGTGGIVECIEIGDGVKSSVFTSMVK